MTDKKLRMIVSLCQSTGDAELASALHISDLKSAVISLAENVNRLHAVAVAAKKYIGYTGADGDSDHGAVCKALFDARLL